MARAKKLAIKVEPDQAVKFTKSFFKTVEILSRADNLKSLDAFALRRSIDSIAKAVSKMWPDENERMNAFLHVTGLHDAGLWPFMSDAYVASERMKSALDEARVQSRQARRRKRV